MILAWASPFELNQDNQVKIVILKYLTRYTIILGYVYRHVHIDIVKHQNKNYDF